MSSRYITLSRNFDALRSKVLESHISDKPREEIALALDKEFRRLAKSYAKGVAKKSSYQILRVRIINANDLSIRVEMRSTSGFTIILDQDNKDVFINWAFAPDKDKEVEQVTHWNGYTIKGDSEHRLDVKHGESK